MKIKHIKHLFIILFVFVYGHVKAQPQNFFLKDSNYYSVFQGSDAQMLNSSFSTKNSTNKNWQKYQKFNNDAKKYGNLARNYSNNPKRKKKFQKKQQKLLKKASKHQIKALDIYLSANSNIKSKYETKINSLQTNEIKLLDTLNDIKLLYIDSARSSKNIASTDYIEIAKKKQAQYNYENKAILFMEYQIALLKADSSVIKPLKAKYFPKSDNTNSNNNNNQVANNNDTVPSWDYRNDDLFFYPINEEMDFKILYVPDDFKDLDRYFVTGNNSFLDLYSTKKVYDSVKVYQDKLLKVQDYRQRYAITEQITNFQKQALSIEIQAINGYYTANELFFLTRMRRINDAPLPDTASTSYKKMYEYIYKAEIFYRDADSSKRNSLKLGGIDKLKAIDRANQQIITALEYLENAFALKFNYDTNAVAIKNKLFSDYNLDKPIPNTDTNKTVKPDTNKTSNGNQTTHVNKPQRIAGLYEYSYDNRTPRLTTTANGTIYRVQVGASINLLPVNELREFDKIYYEQMTNTNLKKFMVGDYTDYLDAQETLQNLKNKGYRTAFIVKYKDGKRDGAVYANNYNSNTNNNNSGSFKNVSNIQVLTYLIKLGTYSSPKTKADLAGYNNLYVRQSNGTYEYFQGPYFRYAEAEVALPNVKQKGFTDAEIIPFNVGKETTLETALRIEGVSATNNNSNNQQTTTSNDLIFRVQVGAFSDYLSDDKINQHFSTIKNAYSFHTHTKNGLIVYSVGNASTYQDAKAIKQNVASKGFPDCYIIAFKNGVLVPLSDVVD